MRGGISTGRALNAMKPPDILPLLPRALAWMFMAWFGVRLRFRLPSERSFLQVASVGFFTPHGLRPDERSGWARLLHLLSTGLGVLLWVVARRRFSPF